MRIDHYTTQNGGNATWSKGDVRLILWLLSLAHAIYRGLNLLQ